MMEGMNSVGHGAMHSKELRTTELNRSALSVSVEFNEGQRNRQEWLDSTEYQIGTCLIDHRFHLIHRIRQNRKSAKRLNLLGNPSHTQ